MTQTTPDRTTREKRLRIRCWRRGTKEMDLILGPFADTGLGVLDDDGLSAFETFLDENDNDLYTWVAGTAETPERHMATIDHLRRFHKIATE